MVPLHSSGKDDQDEVEHNYFYQINDFSLEANIYQVGKVECQLGLEPRSLSVQPSAFTIRPPALIASHCSFSSHLRAYLCDP